MASEMGPAISNDSKLVILMGLDWQPTRPTKFVWLNRFYSHTKAFPRWCLESYFVLLCAFSWTTWSYTLRSRVPPKRPLRYPGCKSSRFFKLALGSSCWFCPEWSFSSFWRRIFLQFTRFLGSVGLRPGVRFAPILPIFLPWLPQLGSRILFWHAYFSSSVFDFSWGF